MKHLSYILVFLLSVSCGSGSDKGGTSPDSTETSKQGKTILGELPEIYGDGYDEMVKLQEEIQIAYRAGGSPDKSVMERMVKLPKEIEAKAGNVPDIRGNEIPLVGENPYDFIKIDKAFVSDVKLRNNSASIYITFQPAEGTDLSMIPRGSTVYYLCLTEDNEVLFKNAVIFPSSGVTSISLSMNPANKVSPVRWMEFAKIKFVSRTDFYALSGRNI